MNRAVGTTAALLLSMLAATSASAQTATAEGELSLQGRLTTSTGQAIANGTHQLAVTLYNRVSGQVAHTEVDVVTTVDGVFSTMIGDSAASRLELDANGEYEIGIAVDGSTELSPRIRIGDVISALKADVAANAEAVGGFTVGAGGQAGANTLLVLDANGRIPSSTLGASVVTGINGMQGNVTIQGGGGLNVSTTGSAINLSFNGSGSGGLNLPFADTVNLGAGATALQLTATGAGSAATFINAGTGAALQTTASAGAAISATTSASGSAAIEASNTAGSAISLVANSSTDAALRIRNNAAAASAKLISATSANAGAAFEVAASGQTTVRSTVGNALDVSTSAAGEAALKLTGGLTMNGPVGTGTINVGSTSTVITNALVKANSVILVTVRSGVDAIPLRIASQGEGTFTVSLINSLAALTGNLTFNYLIINQ